MDRNFILAIVLSLAIFLGYQLFYAGPRAEQYRAYQEALAAEQAAAAEQVDASGGITDGLAGLGDTGSDAPEAAVAPRLPIDTPELEGSLNLRGLVFDDLTLKNYQATVDESSPRIVLLEPSTEQQAQYVRNGLQIGPRRDDQVVWDAPEGAVLRPGEPVTLRARVPDPNFVYTATVSVDEHFMFTVEHAVENKTGADIPVTPYGVATQKSIPTGLENFMILFEGPTAIAGTELVRRKYKKLLNQGTVSERGTGGWVGLTDKYFLSAAIPAPDTPLVITLNASQGALPLFTAQYEREQQIVPAGGSLSVTSQVFVGAKDVGLLREYERGERGAFAIQRFDMAVDWGTIFWPLTRPIFAVLRFFGELTGNYGIAILLLTLCIKAVLFPLANLSYKSMAGMRKVQPEMVRLKEKYKDDQMKQQQEMMALYKKHKINPAAGCLPILAQMPIFFALYKMLFVTIEMRHEPFLYIPDLAEQDPTSVFNLFGLLPFDPTTVPVIGAFLGLGILPLFMGAGMWVQMKLNPPPTDPMQARIFGLMPLFFMFIFAPFAAGLVLYWAWNTILSVMQQYVIMKRNGADVDLVTNIKQSLPFLFKGAATANDNKAK